MTDLKSEKDFKRLIKAMRRVFRISGEAEGDSTALNAERVQSLLSEIRSTAERALLSLKQIPNMTWIEVERKRFRDKWGMTYRRAEQFWYRESIQDRKIDDELAYAIIRQAHLEACWKETGVKPKCESERELVQ